VRETEGTGNMKKKAAYLSLLAILAVLLCAFAVPLAASADVGNQNDYDYGSDDYDSGGYDDYDDYDYDDDDGVDYGSAAAAGIAGCTQGGPLAGAAAAAAVILYGVIRQSLRKQARKTQQRRPTPTRPTTPARPAPPPIERSQAAVDIVQAHDEGFSEVDFIAWAREVFVALNTAWTARDWTSIRIFEDDNLFSEHERQLEDYIRRGQVNRIERLGITDAQIVDHDMDSRYEYLTVKMAAQMVDYVADAQTGAVVAGDPNRVVHMQYTLKFMRTLGTKTVGSLKQIGVTNCPNCGAPTKLTAAGQCEYCKTIITSGQYNWVLVSYTGVHAD